MSRMDDMERKLYEHMKKTGKKLDPKSGMSFDEKGRLVYKEPGDYIPEEYTKKKSKKK